MLDVGQVYVFRGTFQGSSSINVYEGVFEISIEVCLARKMETYFWIANTICLMNWFIALNVSILVFFLVERRGNIV